MLLKLIDSNSPVSFIIDIFLLLLLALGVVFFTPNASFSLFFVLNILAIAATFFVLNIMNDKFHLFKELTYLSSFFYLLLSVNGFPYFFDTLLAVYLLLFVIFLYQTLSVYNQSDVKNLAFNAGFVAGLMVVADKHLLMLGVILFLMLMLSRSFYWREWVLAILGLLLPVFYVEIINYLQVPVSFLTQLKLNGLPVSNNLSAVFSAASVLFFILTFIYMGHKTVRKRNIYTALLATMIVILLVKFIFNIKWIVFFTFPLIAVLATHLYHQLRTKVLRWLVLIVCVVLSFVNYFF